jgi:ATP-dependent DNA helicase RecQ
MKGTEVHSAADSATSRVRAATRDILGFADLRPGQAEAMTAAVAGRDVLAVLATGSGKSAIYQVAGALRGGTTVVVSPLIALQRDQLRRLEQHADRSHTVVELNASEPAAVHRAAVEELHDGRVGFVLLAPEQLANAETMSALRAARPRLVAVDEAHLVSEWGQDFRPDYLRLAAAVQALGRPPIVALTATAAPPVRDEIAFRLGMRDPALVVGGFDRPEIWLGATQHADETHKHRHLLNMLSGATGPGIVYTATHRHADDLADELTARGRRAAAYHAGLSGSERTQVQDMFFAGDVQIVVATVAFGMGIDKPDIRWVYHADPSGSVDAYYQEAGRAGRDGRYAEARLFYREQDLGLRRAFASRGGASPDDVAAVLHALAAGPAGDAELRSTTELSHARITRTVSRLADAGWVSIDTAGTVTLAAEPGRTGPDIAAAQRAVAAAEQQRHDIERSRVEMVARYAEHRYCRRAWLLGYFGEPYPAPCNNCDNCDAGRGLAPTTGAGQPFAVGSRVTHTTFGVGTVERYDGDHVLVLFDHAGYKTLLTAVAVARGALEAIPP